MLTPYTLIENITQFINCLNFFDHNNEVITPIIHTKSDDFIRNRTATNRTTWMEAKYDNSFYTTIEHDEKMPMVYHFAVCYGNPNDMYDMNTNMRMAGYNLIRSTRSHAYYKPIGDTYIDQLYAFRAFHRIARESSQVSDSAIKHIGFLVDGDIIE